MDNPQQFLDSIAVKDKYGFLQGLQGQNLVNHRVLLYLSLELTKESILPVVEYGSGWGSTPFLRSYCKEYERNFLTYDSNEEWAAKCESVFIEDWGTSNVFDGEFSVGFVDGAPGYFRKRMLELLKGKADIIVIHDSEKFGCGDYQLEPMLDKYLYRINHNTTQGGAGVSMVSDTIDLTVFDKCTLNEFLLEV